MAGIMSDAIGVGLAAPQLGISQRLLVYRIGSDAPLITLVNPELEWHSEDQETFEEGCLSIPERRGRRRAAGPRPRPRAGRARRGAARRGLRARGARDPARDGPPRRRPHARPRLARGPQGGTTRPPRAGAGRSRRLTRCGRSTSEPRTSPSPCSSGWPTARWRPAARDHAPRPAEGTRAQALAAARGDGGARARDRGRPARQRELGRGARADRRARARRDADLRVRRADQGAAPVRLRVAERAPVAAAALARRGADRAGDRRRRRATGVSIMRPDRGDGRRARSACSATSRSPRTTPTARSRRGSPGSAASCSWRRSRRARRSRSSPTTA